MIVIAHDKGIKPYSIIAPDFSRPVWSASLPYHAIVPLLQHQGVEALPLVKKGDHVREGLLIGRCEEGKGAAVHAPIPGVVEDVVDMNLPSGEACRGVLIRLEGQFDYLGKPREPHAWQDLSPLALIDLISEKGLVHMDGFTEPLGDMLRDMRKHKAGSIVVNAASGYPFLSNEIRLLKEHPAEIVEALKILSRILSTEDVWLVHPASHRRYISEFGKTARSQGVKLRRKPRSDKYPAGDPYELIHLVSKKELMPQADFSSSPVAVLAVSTLFAVYEAVVLRKALVDRLITLGGGALGETRTVRVRIGTPISAVFEEVGGLQQEAAKLLVGNPLQGYEIVEANSPVTKQVTAVLALTREELGVEQERPCIQCGACVDHCPANLEPVILHKLLRQDRLDEALEAGLNACRVCGICSHVCPSHIPLTQIIRDGMVKSGETSAIDESSESERKGGGREFTN